MSKSKTSQGQLARNKTLNEPVTSSVGVIGGGWFGKAFAKHLVSAGNSQVILTTRTADNLSEFAEIGVAGELLSLPLPLEDNGTFSVLKQQTLIIAIPPGFKKGRTDYARNIAEVVAQAKKGSVETIILLNSTAIYNGLSGTVDEKSTLQLSAEKVALLAEAEIELFKFSGRSCSLRLAGLVGEDRHPGRFVANAVKQQRVMPEPNAHVNLIHQADVIGLVKALIQQDVSGIFNGVSATYSDKKSYYQQAAKSLNIAAPQFKESLNTVEDSKKVVGNITREALHYRYQFDDLIKWLAESSVS